MSVSQICTSVSTACFRKLENHAALIVVSLTATAIFIAIYRKLHHPDVVPFNHWSVSLGLSENKLLDSSEISDLEKASQTYTPLELTCRLYAYAQDRSLPKERKTRKEWVDWISSASQENLSKEARSILPSNRHAPQVMEDAKVSFIQAWVPSLQPIFALISDNALPWKELLSPIQASPRIAYTILFNCFAPFAASMVWEGIYDYLPESLQEIGSRYVEHKGTIAVVCFALLALLYYKMRQEKGILVNLTNNFAHLHKTHQALDQIPSYQEGIQKLLQTVQTTTPKDSNSNILWYYPRDTHKTFVGKIGDALAEMTAAGRNPKLPHLQVIEFDVKLFLTEYRSEDTVYQGWHGALSHLNNPNTLVVFTEIDALIPFLTTERMRPKSNDNDGPPGRFQEDPEGKILFDLITLALREGKIRCLMELDEEDKNAVARNPKIMHFFTAIKSPDITPQHLQEFCEHSFTRSDTSGAFTKEQIDKLFARISPTLEKTAIPPEDITDFLQQELRSHMRSWSEKADASEVSKIRLAEQHLDAVQAMKDQILLKLRQEKTEPKSLLQALLLLEHIVIPLYRDNVDALKKPHWTPLHLTKSIEKRFSRLFGAASPEEQERLLQVPARLKTGIKGQDAAIDAMCSSILEWRRVPPLDGKPLVLFFAGTPGVGKSETATRLAFELNTAYGIVESPVKTDESNVKRINLNRRDQGGIFGWDQLKSQILIQLLQAPASVIILEEWDKMSEQDKSSLLELLDGTQNHFQTAWSIGKGPFVDKSCAIFVLTSNISTENENTTTAQKAVEQNIMEGFENEVTAQAFVSRIDAIIPFEKVSDTATQNLIKTYLDQYQAQQVLPAEKRSIVEQSLRNTHSKDARELQRIVRKTVTEALGQASST